MKVNIPANASAEHFAYLAASIPAGTLVAVDVWEGATHSSFRNISGQTMQAWVAEESARVGFLSAHIVPDPRFYIVPDPRFFR